MADVRTVWLRIAAFVATVGLLLGSVVTNDMAFAVEYPSWSDVLKARQNIAQKEKAIAELKSIIRGLEKKAETATAEAQRVGTLYQEAQQLYDEAAYKADQLQSQADDATQAADASRIRAGQFVSELARVGNVNVSTSLLSDASDAENLLSRLGFASIIASQADGIYQAAIRDKNSAQSLTDQAEVAKKERDILRDAAEASFEIAQDAAIAAENAFQEQQTHQATLLAQLATLVQNRRVTEREYKAGVEANGTAGSDLPPGAISSKGWARPAAGYISSNFGYRTHPIYNTVKFHAGTDLAGGCGIPIYAARGGQIVYAGWNGGYGNFILINHGDGITTGYAHIATGKTFVRFGEQVSTGTHIANVGSTGASTGCHLHFEVREGGRAINPVPFMKGKGITLG
ncbi:MAG: M23 family metallopeptidase [Microbacteriaceae bacterium]|nr:M23 family metallopeptidase [Microbacteriaceae bacterium]